MTAKEKAIELVYKMGDHHSMMWYEAKQCALIAVDEILEATAAEYQIQYDNGEWSREIGYRYSEYWQEVMQEIEKL